MQALSSASEHHGLEDNNAKSNGLHMTPPTPLFERLVTEEVQELKSCLRMIDNQQRRLNELERVHGDLETRLEQESRGRAQLETTLEQREREWAAKFKELETDRDHWKQIVKFEKSKNDKLIQQVYRKDQDIHRMLQRKVRGLDFRNFACRPFLLRDTFSMSSMTKKEKQPVPLLLQYVTYDISSVKDREGHLHHKFHTRPRAAAAIAAAPAISINIKVPTKSLLPAVRWRPSRYGTCRMR